MKYIVTALSTTLLLSLMLHIANYEDMYHIKQSNKIGDEIVRNMCNRIMELELQTED